MFTIVISALLCQHAYGVAASTTSAKNRSDVNRGLEACKKLLTEGRIADALAKLNNLKQLAPHDSRLYFFSGIALAEAKRLDQAVVEFQQARGLSPKQPEYAVASANVLSLLGRSVEALQTLSLFERRELLNHLATDWLWLLGDVYYRLGKTQEARRILEFYARRRPRDPNIPLREAQISIIENDFARAEDYLKRAMAASPERAEVYFELGKIQWLANELSSSKENSLVAVRRNPTNPEYLYQLARICMALKETNDAIGYLQRAESAGADPAKVYRALGEAFQQLGDSARSKQYLETYQHVVSTQAQQESRDQEISNLIEQGQLKLEKGRVSEAQDSFRQALKISPDNWLAHAYLAETYLSREPSRPELAYPHVVKMQQLDPDSAEGNILAAVYWYKQLNPESARLYAEKAKISRPGDAELRNLLGNIYVALGDTNKALKEYAIAMRMAPERWDFKQNYQSTYKRAKQTSAK